MDSSATLDRLTRLAGYIEADPTNPDLRRDAAEACLSVGRADDALLHAETGLVGSPGDPQLLNTKARALMSLGRHAEAAPLLSDLLRTRSDAALAFNLAYAQLQSGNPQGAKDTLTPYVSTEAALEPALATLWIRCLHHLAQLDDAMSFARLHEPRCGSVAAFLGAAALAYFDGEAFDDAARASGAALALDPSSVDALVVRGSLALGRGDEQAAISDFAQAVALRPHDGRSVSGLGMAKLLAGDATGARSTLQQAVSLMSSHIGTWHALGWACIALRAFDEAGGAFQRALELDHNFGESHGAMAVVAALTGRSDDARAAIDRALRLDPQGLSARYAEMILSGEAADPARFDRAARRVLSSRSLPGGLTVADLLARRK